jgi:proline iminopeptidase
LGGKADVESYWLIELRHYRSKSCSEVVTKAASGEWSVTFEEGAMVERYFDNQGRGDLLAGGVKLIEISTPAGTQRVWTKRIGNNPKLRLLLLHGGPAATHEYLEACDSYLPGAGVEYYYYDQLGSYRSDQPENDDLWTLDRFVDEVEQVRLALGLDSESFCLFGHSWGGMLAIEYALKYQQNLKALVISNMMASIPAYNEYAERMLMPAMDQDQLAEVRQLEADDRTGEPRYMELLMPMHYEKHVLRMPAQQWPEPVTRSFKHRNHHVYALMQGPSELGASGRMAGWDRTADVSRLEVPTLVRGATHDTMDPSHLRMMAERLPKGEFLLCPNGSHMAMYDDQPTYFSGLIRFLTQLNGS